MYIPVLALVMNSSFRLLSVAPICMSKLQEILSEAGKLCEMQGTGRVEALPLLPKLLLFATYWGELDNPVEELFYKQ